MCIKVVVHNHAARAIADYASIQHDNRAIGLIACCDGLFAHAGGLPGKLPDAATFSRASNARQQRNGQCCQTQTSPRNWKRHRTCRMIAEAAIVSYRRYAQEGARSRHWKDMTSRSEERRVGKGC